MRLRRPPLQHPLAPAFAHAVESLSTALTPSSKRNYDIAVRSFLVYLATKYPKITRLEQLRRDPHILGWMAHLSTISRSSIGNLCSGCCGFFAPTWPSYSASHPLCRREDGRSQTGCSRRNSGGRPPTGSIIARFRQCSLPQTAAAGWQEGNSKVSAIV
jgi:hypothetical protein